MREPAKPSRMAAANGKSKTNRHSVMQRMVDQLLARIDPHGYAELLAALGAEHQPVGQQEEDIVKCMAAAFWRTRGCFAMEAEILRKGMRTFPAGQTQPDAMLHAYMLDFKGPDLLSKLGAYQSKLQNESSLCLRQLERYRTFRRRASDARAAEFANLKPCTSVVQ